MFVEARVSIVGLSIQVTMVSPGVATPLHIASSCIAIHS